MNERPDIEIRNRGFNWKLFIEITQVVTAITAIVATTAAIYYSNSALKLAQITFQTDAYYKEISIQPALNITIDNADNSIRMQNLGSGAARLTELRIRYRSICITTNNVDRSDFRSNLDTILDTIASSAVSSTLNAADIAKMETNGVLNHYKWIPTKDSTIGTGLSVQLVRFEQDPAKLASITTDKVEKISDAINEEMGFLEMEVIYESITGKYTARTGHSIKCN